MNGLFGAIRLDNSAFDPSQVPRLAEALVGGSPVIHDGSAAVFAGGWAAHHREPDGLWVVGAAHLVGPDAAEARTHGALEIIAALYRAHGPDAFTRILGQFCIALYDPAVRRLIVATDRFATRVVYWAAQRGTVFFSSRLGWLPHTLREHLDHQALLEYLLYTVVPHPRTPFAGVHKVDPGHLLITDASGVRSVSYWEMSYPEERNGISVGAWGERLRDEIAAAVRRQLVGEDTTTGVGAFLSGGTDSSTVAGMVTALTGTPAKAFSIGYAEPGYDELTYARTAASWFGLEHYEHCLTPAEAFNLLPDIVRFYDEPFGNSSALPTYSCARFAREHGVHCLLAGDGGDELFGGNSRYRTDAIFGLYQQLPQALRRSVTDTLIGALPDGVPVLGQARRYVRRSNIPNPRRFFSYHFLLAEPLPALLTPEFLQAVDASQLLATAERYFHSLPAGTAELNRLLFVDLKLAIADNDVRKVSGTAELAGIDVRYPFLDTQLAELSGRIPAGLKVRRLEKRYLFKQALADFLPPAILTKPKHGFGTPIAGWMKTDPRWRELVADVLHDRRTRERGYLLPAVLDALWQQHQTEESAYYGDLLWPVLMLELWQREHVDGG